MKFKVTDTINLRSGASLASPVIGSIPKGSIVEGDAYLWKMVVLLDGRKGYCAGTYLEEVAPVVPPPVIFPGITVSQLLVVVTLPATVAPLYVPYINETMQQFGITTPLRQAMFLAQIAHESAGLKVFMENLNYTSTQLRALWPSRFTSLDALTYALQPQKIANRAYANRNGNGSEASGDGWKYRGRGAIQVTFKDNYRACGIRLGLDLVANPELLEDARNAFRSAGWYWESRNMSVVADTGNFESVTKLINGGLNGIEDRKKYYARARSALGLV